MAVGPPSSLLRYLAGDFAPKVAGLWPQPHAEFLTAPAERRHLVCLALVRAGDKALAFAPDALLDLALADATALVLPEPPQGLRRALQRLGETAWTAENYRTLLEVLACPHGCKTLRHAKAIRPGLVAALAALPVAVTRAGVGASFALSGAQARVLADAYATVVRTRGEEAAAREALRWGGARSASKLFETVADSLTPELPPAPFPGTDKLRPLATKAAIRDAAGRYRNCLRTYVAEAARGRCAIYEWTGQSGAVVEIVPDQVVGWRLNQARTHRNGTPAEPMRREIVAELKRMGVHVGRTGWQLERAVESAEEDWFSYETDEEAVAELFGA